MAQSMDKQEQNNQPKDMGTTIVELAKRSDGTWEATQSGLEVIGTGPSAARATEDMAGQIADLVEAGEL